MGAVSRARAGEVAEFCCEQWIMRLAYRRSRDVWVLFAVSQVRRSPTGVGVLWAYVRRLQRLSCDPAEEDEETDAVPLNNDARADPRTGVTFLWHSNGDRPEERRYGCVLRSLDPVKALRLEPTAPQT